MPFGDHFFLMTLTNCDLNLYSHILYKPLQDSDYMNFFLLQNNSFMLKIKVPIVKFILWVIPSFSMHY
jgi:hypothetical protein